MILDKIKIEKLKKRDWEVFFRSLQYYLEYLDFMIKSYGSSQQYIHCSIAVQVMEPVQQKLIKRSFPDSSSLKLEVSQAFILNDALRHFMACSGSNDFEKSISRRLIINLTAKLPSCVDLEKYSVESEL